MGKGGDANPDGQDGKALIDIGVNKHWDYGDKSGTASLDLTNGATNTPGEAS